ncbi:MAG TPA: hypothetical protein VK993_02965, partial [Chthoniobacterales bacterium]|nr:hypothetical protein [Chthoniobacterales bacterium]
QGLWEAVFVAPCRARHISRAEDPFEDFPAVVLEPQERLALRIKCTELELLPIFVVEKSISSPFGRVGETRAYAESPATRSWSTLKITLCFSSFSAGTRRASIIAARSSIPAAGVRAFWANTAVATRTEQQRSIARFDLIMRARDQVRRVGARAFVNVGGVVRGRRIQFTIAVPVRCEVRAPPVKRCEIPG